MASETIEFLASFVIVVTVITGGILNTTQYLSNAFNYDVDQSVSTKAKDVLMGILENSGAPSDWEATGVDPTVFGLRWMESASSTPNPFGVARMFTPTSTITYGGASYYDLSKNGFSLYYNKDVCLEYDDVKNLVDPNGRYDLQISFKPVLNVTSDYTEPTLSVRVIGPSGPVTGASVLLSVFKISGVDPDPLEIERDDYSATTSAGSCSFDVNGVESPFFAYIRVIYGGLSSTSYFVDQNLDEPAVTPIMTDYGNAEVTLSHRRDVSLYSDYIYSGEVDYNSVFLIPSEDDLLYVTPLSDGVIEYNMPPPKISLSEFKSTPGVLLTFYERATSEDFGVMIMPWGVNSLGISTTYGDPPDHVVNVATQSIVSNIGTVSYTTEVKLWRDIISTETVSRVKEVTITSNPFGSGYVVVDGVTITTPQTFNWQIGEVHDLQAASLVSSGSDTKYRFIGWSDGGEESHQYTVTTSTTISANYKAQYEVVFTTEPTTGGSISPATTAFFDAGSEIALRAFPNSEYGFTSWSSSNDATTFTIQEMNTTAIVGGPSIIKANFIYGVVSVTITSNPLGPDLVLVDGVEIQTPHTFNWVAGDTHTIQANSEIPISANSRYAFSDWSDGGSETHSYLVATPTTITAHYNTQYLVKFSSSGLDASTSGTIVTVDGDDVVSIPYEKWYTVGASTTYTFRNPVDSTTTGKQFRLLSVGGLVSGSIVSSASTINAVYLKQYQVTFSVNPIGYGTTDPSGTDVWFDEGTLPISATSTTGHIFSIWSSSPTIVITGPISPITTATISGPGSITANFANGPVDIWIKSTPAGPGYVVIDGTPVSTPVKFSWEVGSTHAISANTLVDGVPGTRYEYSGWSDAGEQTHNYYVSAAANITANFKTQYYWRFTSSGLDGTVAPSTVVVNAGTTPITYGQLPYTDWFDSGTPYTYSSTVESRTSGKRFSYVAPTSLSPPSGGNTWWTVVGSYSTQYQVIFTATSLDATATGKVVTVAGVPVSVGSMPYTSSWVNSGSSLVFSYEKFVSTTLPTIKFSLVSTTNTSPITVTSPMTVTATYEKK